MTTHTWDYNRSLERIEKSIDSVASVEIKEYVRYTSLISIAKNRAYKVDAVHLYADIVNLDDMLDSTDAEGETCHKRTLRFLDLHFRAVHRILAETDAEKVDFHNQRLHMFLAKPYNSENNAEAKRINTAIAIGQLIIDVLDETGETDDKIENAKIRIGIDSGTALAVSNGRRSNREPLFLGSPANLAAKLASGKKTGIYLTNNARKAIGLAEVANEKTTALTKQEISNCQEEANLSISKEDIIQQWEKDLKDRPIGSFVFKGHTPPLADLDINQLTPANSRRQDLVSIYADIDGFTNYVAENIDKNPKDVVKTLAVLREELDNVLSKDFKGRRIRFIGDCIHGLMCSGTAQTTDTTPSISDATLCVGALRSGFNLALEKLQDSEIETGNLGLAIGFDYGVTATTRLGFKGSRTRCSLSRTVRNSEQKQLICSGKQTAIGDNAYNEASDGVKKLFKGKERIANELDYNEAVDALSESGDLTAKASQKQAYTESASPVYESLTVKNRPYTDS